MIKMSFSVVVLFVMFASTAADSKRVCYMSNWSQYRNGAGEFFPTAINPVLCSHIIYAFANMNGNLLEPYEWDDDSTAWSVGLYQQLYNQKARDPSLKTLLAVGGWNFGTEPMTAMLATEANRQEFISTSIEFLRNRNFDGLDLDFEYPGQRGSPEGDKYLFTTLVTELRAAFVAEAATTGNDALLLTIAVAAGKNNTDYGYEIPALSQQVDWFNLMTYDFNGAWDTITGLNAPLYARADEVGEEYEGADRTTLNVNWTVQYWLSNGAPKEKLIVGLSTYGRCFQLANANVNGLGAPVIGPCNAGPYTAEAGFLSYYEICSILSNPATVQVYSEEQQAPFAYTGDQWVGYDDLTSLQAKMNYIKSQDLGGYMVWNIDLDDFNGNFCNKGSYPLLSNLNLFFTGSIPTESATTVRLSTTPVPTQTLGTGSTAAGGGGDNGITSCVGEPNGSYMNPSNCTSFIVCSNQIKTVQNCPPSLYYNAANQVCDWPASLSTDRQKACGLS